MTSSSLHASLAAWVAGGTATVHAVQRFCGVRTHGPTNSILHALFTLGAALGNELFFITFLPWVFWEYDWWVGRRIVHLWACSYYAGQLAKDVLQLPRPPARAVLETHLLTPLLSPVAAAGSIKDDDEEEEGQGHGKVNGNSNPSPKPSSPTVVRLERHYETEYGMPSTHAMNGLAMPGALLALSLAEHPQALAWLRAQTGAVLGALGLSLQASVAHGLDGAAAEGEEAGRFRGSPLLLSAFCLTWFVLCTLSRLYMGVHSPADIVTGLALGATTLSLHLLYGHVLDGWTLFSPWAGLAIPVVAAAVIWVYPKPASPRWVSTPGDTAVIVGVWAGVSLGARAFAPVHAAAMGQEATAEVAGTVPGLSFGSFPASQLAGMPVRLLLGFAVLVLTRAVVKAAGTALLVLVLGHEYAPQAEVGEGGDSRHSSATPGGGNSSSSGKDESGGSSSSSSASSAPSSAGNIRRRGHVQLEYEGAVTGTGSSATSSSSLGSPTAGDRPQLQIRAPQVEAGAAGQHSPAGSAVSISSRTPGPGLVRVPPGRRYAVELPVKLLTYGAVGFNALVTVPLLFQALGMREYGMPMPMAGAGGAGAGLPWPADALASAFGGWLS